MSRQGGSPVMMWAAPWGRMGRQEGTNLTLEQRRKYNKGRGSCYLFAHLARAVDVYKRQHLAHLVRYIATREGVEMARDTHDHLPATARQKQLIDELLRALPDTQESYEYRDYQANPTMGNASAFIAISIEQNMDLVAKKENYVDYIDVYKRQDQY